MKRLKVLALESYYGGSHRAFLDTWMRHSVHDWTLETLPARHWKWRMRGSALWFVESLRNAPAGGGDVIFTCDMTAVSDLRALLPSALAAVPIVCYFHENQLTYPLSPTDRRDYQYGFTNITSALAADAVWFNSHAHRSAFLDAAAEVLGRMSDFVPAQVVGTLERVGQVHYPAVEPPPQSGRREGASAEGPLRILWCHRWEYDKNPEAFFEVVSRLHDAGADFELVFVGERFRTTPAAFADGCRRWRRRIVHAGYLESREAYWKMISSCHVVVSTAIQENFGLAVVEAILAGCHPLLPNRLSYPELLPPALRDRYLYAGDGDLHRRLLSLCRTRGHPDEHATGLRILRCALAERFAAPGQVRRLDEALGACVQDWSK